ncbi:N-terminal nucleophile aminohydrolase [Trematosphaeria pertusa]|uniref:N-terminal nucleophile aminohydrolase n=1 Tax=Trematosphaeria pertusa TaxID=390896 RepID=A0A6A6ILD6_9PLEO|nr:N-terminal nucleophile aminohydrolase [Trematosphaeria pertusa]KAF2250303.1 N-terminal nucleophile aminohydrolase [Trematosphaeria pertusa]
MASTQPPSSPQPRITPRIIIHGGAGNITRQTVSRARYNEYQTSLRQILAASAEVLNRPGATALDVATYAVSLLEDDPLYNSGKGAVFTREGKNELECSIMVSNGYRKRGVGCMMLRHVKNPIKLARELLIRGESEDGEAKDHCQYAGAYVESLAKKWGLDMVDPCYFFTKRKWNEHLKGLKEEERQKEKERKLKRMMPEMSDWEKTNYIPRGTCGAVVLDSFGTICVATSTGGLTNKCPGRIGDTPTMGAGYWAEEWYEDPPAPKHQMLYQPAPISPLDRFSRGDLRSLVGDCVRSIGLPTPTPSSTSSMDMDEKPSRVRHAVGMSGSGNGDTFIRLAAASTTAAKSRFTPMSLTDAVAWMTGPGGELQRSAGDRWGRFHEGVGGMIGIELVGNKATVICDYNCGGFFRAWTEEDGEQRCLIFREDRYESGPEGWFSDQGMTAMSNIFSA